MEKIIAEVASKINVTQEYETKHFGNNIMHTYFIKRDYKKENKEYTNSVEESKRMPRQVSPCPGTPVHKKPGDPQKESTMMWKCPRCKVTMKRLDEPCSKCGNDLEYLENGEGFPREDMVFKSSTTLTPKSFWICTKCNESQSVSKKCNGCGLNYA